MDDRRDAARFEDEGHDSAHASDGDRPAIVVDGVTHAFGDHRVLEDVSLAVDEGELVGLVGPNGAGKTTLLRTVTGAITPASGTVTIDGVDVHGVDSRTSSRLVSVVPQDTSLSFSFPVRDVVAMGRHPHRSRFSPPSTADRRAVEAALERTRTADLAGRPIDELSGGQRQRVVLARAIAQEAPVVVLDEPTANLDVAHRIETLELVRDLVGEGRSVVAAIHDLSLAARYCDRLVLLADGRVRGNGPPESVLTTDALAEAFDASAVVTTNPVTGTETVTALPVDAVRGRSTVGGRPRVHVLGGRRTAAAVLARLSLAGADVSIGPVPSGDIAAETAARLECSVLEVDPFDPPAAAERSRVTEWIRDADVVVLATPHLGEGPTFRQLLETVEAAPSLVVVDPETEADRSRPDGEVGRRYDRCVAQGLTATSETVVDAVWSASQAQNPAPTGETSAEADAERSPTSRSGSAERNEPPDANDSAEGSESAEETKSAGESQLSSSARPDPTED